MNPTKRKKLYRAALAEEAKKESAPVVQEKKVETTVKKSVELPLGLKELPKQVEPKELPKEMPKEESITAPTEQPETTVEQTANTTKKKKV